MNATMRLVMAGAVALSFWAAPAAAEQRLDYSISEGRNLNLLFRDGPVAAHVIARSGTEPRLIVAFPAGNSGTAVWFKSLAAPASWRSLASPKPVQISDHAGRPLYGVEVELETTARQLEPKAAVLSSVRVIRDYEGQSTIPDGVQANATIATNTLGYARDRLDGRAGYFMSLTVTAGRLDNGVITAAEGPIRLKLIAASGETPLTPLGGSDLLNGTQQPDDAAIRALTFLSFREKFLAGSWRFDTYFGRDTLMSVRLLLPVLTPAAVKTGLRSVLTRLSPAGEVAHEEDIGEFALLDHRRNGEPMTDAPVYDYKMVDGDFLLAPVMADWLATGQRPQVAALLAEPDPAGRKLGDALVRNLRHVMERARPFAQNSVYGNLVGLKPGVSVGDWRDSNTGLGGGFYPYDINAVFVPAALAATVRLFKSGVLDPYLAPADRSQFAEAGLMAAVWSRRAPQLFEVAIPGPAAATAIRQYAGEIAVAAPNSATPVRFPALSLKADGSPVKVQNSDIGFALLFSEPSPDRLREAAEILTRPFPAGLMTGAGMLVANPAFATDEQKAMFNRNAYHGTVIWSWQQAVAAAGLARQLRRNDLPQPVRTALQSAQSKLQQAIRQSRRIQGSELWSWDFAAGQYRIVPFGAAHSDVDESNAVQLWSTVFLALPDQQGNP